MKDEELNERFLGVLSDLKYRFQKNGRHNLVSTSQQLRFLFLDGPSLLTMLKVNYGLEPKFEIRPDQIVSNGGWKFSCLEPSFPSSPRISVTAKQFMDAECIVYGEHRFSVRDAINACAYLKYAIHVRRAKTTKEEMLLLFDQTAKIGKFDGLHAVMADATRITLAGLALIEEDIKAKSTG